MSIAIRADREGDRIRLIPTGFFDLPHVMIAAQAIADVEATLSGCRYVDLDLREVTRLDGSGAVQLARLLDRLDAAGRIARVMESRNPEAARLIARYREHRAGPPASHARPTTLLARLGALAAQLTSAVSGAFDFTGRSAAALPKAAMAPRSVDWRSLPGLIQAIGADGLPVTSAANLLLGLIMGFMGVSQLGRFGASGYVPEVVVVTHFRELGPLVTAVIVAGRSGAGLASEIATMKVSEEIDALRAMGFDPVRWLVAPRCLALVIVLPVLTWVGDLLAILGGLAATTVISDMSVRAYLIASADAITAPDFLGGLAKSPFLALAIGLIACGQGLAAHGGAVAVGVRTTSAVVLSIVAVITISSAFTFLYALIGV